MSLNEIKKEFQIAGKGHNEILEIVDLLEEQRIVTAVTGAHVSENGGTCHILNKFDSPL
jgi:hypothetical protein